MVEKKPVAILVDINSPATYPVNTEKPEAIVIHCVDPRFQDAFQRFISDTFGFRNYVPMVIGGGVHAFGAESFYPDYFKIIRDKVMLFVELMEVKQIVLINHEDCKWYQQFIQHYPDGDYIIKGKNDLVAATEILKNNLSNVTISSYWAELDGVTVKFKKVVQG